jgi:hypothetical protein
MRRCRCGHSWDFHQHYRAGYDCSRCGCLYYRRRSRRLLRRLWFRYL